MTVKRDVYKDMYAMYSITVEKVYYMGPLYNESRIKHSQAYGRHTKTCNDTYRISTTLSVLFVQSYIAAPSRTRMPLSAYHHLLITLSHVVTAPSTHVTPARL